MAQSNSTSESLAASSSSSLAAAAMAAPRIQGGELQVIVVSLNHLPRRESPSHVQLQACGETCKTGPLLSRHKASNSFKFTTSTNPQQAVNNSLVIKAKTLEYLYQTSFVITVVYDDDSNSNLKATFAMKELLINQPTNLLLELQGSDSKNSPLPKGQSEHPTIQLQVELRGSLRPEVQRVAKFGLYWFQLVDAMERNVCRFLPTNPAKQRLLLIPAVPALLAALLLAPLVGVIFMVALPFMFPMVAMVMTAAACIALAFAVVYASTSRGRQALARLFLDHMVQSSSGQAMLYPIGPRPTVVTMTRAMVPNNMYGRLFLSLLIDAIGSSSYLLPFFGEASDALWAPLQTLLIMAMYNETSPKLKYLSFAEEILPFTDVIPSATIGWAVEFGPRLFFGSKNSTDKDKMPDDLQLKEE